MPPVINKEKCTQCGKCYEGCQSDVFFGSVPGVFTLAVNAAGIFLLVWYSKSAKERTFKPVTFRPVQFKLAKR